jgi:hypothetical protein
VFDRGESDTESVGLSNQAFQINVFDAPTRNGQGVLGYDRLKCDSMWSKLAKSH